MGGNELKSDPILLDNGHNRYWKIQLNGETQFNESQLPEINVSRQQQQIIFLAQGAEPYSLAYGHTKIQPARDSGISQLIRTLKDAGTSPDQVVLGDRVKITDKLEIASETPWKRIGLWLILLLGTAIMGYMANSLYRQMNSEK